MRIPNQISLEKEGQYCLACNANTISRFIKDDRTYYRCASCGAELERSLVIDNALKWWVDTDRTYWHESAGIIVIDDQDRILCMLRKIFPFVYTIPAGHLDTGETPEVSARRELQEETGLIIRENEVFEHLIDVSIEQDSCRRGSDHHLWHLYRTRVQNGMHITLSDEASEVKWCTLSELRELQPRAYPLTVLLAKLGDSFVR